MCCFCVTKTLTVFNTLLFFSHKVEMLVRRVCGDSMWEFNLRDILRWCQLIKEHQVHL